MNFKTRILMVISGLLLLTTGVYAQRIPDESWLGVYFGQSKIGYANFTVDKSMFEGKEGYRMDSTLITRTVLLGVTVEQDVRTTIYMNEKFDPLYQIFKMSSSGHATTVTARYSEKEIVAELESQGVKSTKIVPIPEGSKIVSDNTFLPPSMKLKVGDKLDFKVFDPLTIALEDVHTEVQGQEPLVLDGKTYDAFVVKSNTNMGEITCWQTADGDLLKAVGIMGITMVRESKEKAMGQMVNQQTYTPSQDLAVSTSAPTNVNIANPRDVRFMKVRLSGLSDKGLIISDSRQVAKSLNSGATVEYEISATEPNRDKAASLPIKRKDLEQYLVDSPYVQSNSDAIINLAKQIVGDEKNSVVAAHKIRAWVTENMQPCADIGIVRSAVDVLSTKTGVCRDYAVLYTALARAAGIPTKMASGVVYWKGGFYYHAWAESYLGKWFPMDATLPSDFVDATHIKFAEGDATSMFNIAKTMGSIKADIVEYR